MRVLHAYEFYLPSTLSWTAAMLDVLASAGVDIEIATPWLVQGPFFNPAFRYHRFPLQPRITSEWQAPFLRRLFTGIQRRIPVYPKLLEAKIKSEPPDIIHAHFGPIGCLYQPVAERLGIPLVVTFYGFDYTKVLHLRPFYKEKYKSLFKSAARVLVASETGRQQMIKLGCPAEKLAVVPPSPKLEQFPFVNRSKEKNRLRLVQAATFNLKKGHETTLEAFRLALADCPNMHLTLAGEVTDNSLTDALKAYIDRHQLGSSVSWAGFVNHHSLAGFLTDFDVFIHPSRHTPDGDHEATPVVLLEAQATGLPVLATLHFDLPDEVQHGRTGLLTPENDAPALAESIRYFYNLDYTAYQTYSRAARAHIEEHFDVQKSALRLLNVYKEIKR